MSLDMAFIYWALDVTEYQWLCRVEQLLLQALEGSRYFVSQVNSHHLCRDWDRACKMWGEEFRGFLFCFSQKTHDPEEDLLLLLLPSSSSSSSSFLRCCLAGNYFVSHDITWERCFTVRHERAVSHVCSKGATYSQIRLYTWMSFHREELADSCVFWSWLSGREVVKIISMIKLQPSGDCAVWRMNRISARLCQPTLRCNDFWKGRPSPWLFKWRGYLKTLPPAPDYYRISTIPCLAVTCSGNSIIAIC